MDVKLLDEIERAPLDEIPARAVAAVVRRVLERDRQQTVVDVAMFGSAI